MRVETDYKPITDDQQTSLLAQSMPQGRAWNAKGDPETNLYKMLKSIATEINSLEAKIFEMVTEWNINNTILLISEWEVAVGIPDACRNTAEDIATRRTDVITKLKKVPIITIADYQALAEAITGEPAANWNIRPGIDDFPADPLFRFVLLVTSPIVTSAAFEYPFGSGFESGIGLTRSGTTVTATVSDTSTMVLGGTVIIAGAVESEYNGSHVIDTIPLGTTFTYEIADTPASPATGTITVTFGIDQTQIDALAANSQFIFASSIAFPGYPFAGSFRTDILNCVFRKVTPANVVVVFD